MTGIDLISQDEFYLKEYSGSGGIGRENGTYACAYMDFSKLGTDFHINELAGLGFSSTCCHGCGHHYSVQFVDNSDNEYNLDKTTENGIKYSEKWGSSSLIQIDISGISDDSNGGEALTKAIVSATKASSIADNHWELCKTGLNTHLQLTRIHPKTHNIPSPASVTQTWQRKWSITASTI